MEGGVDLVGGIARPDRVVANFEREARLVEIEQLARHHPPFAPPTVRIDQSRAIARREIEQHRRLIGAVRAPGVLNAREQEAWIVPERRGNREGERRRQRPARGGDAGLGQRGDVGAGERGGAQRGSETLRIDETVGAIFVVSLGEHGAEVAQDQYFGRRVEIAVAPQRANDPSRLVGPPGRIGRARGGEHSRARLRRLAGEICGDLRRRVGMDQQIGFLTAPNPSFAWPSGMGSGEGGQSRERRMSIRTQRRPFQRQTLVGVARRLGERREAGGVALAIELSRHGVARRLQRLGRGLLSRGRRIRSRGRGDGGRRAGNGRGLETGRRDRVEMARAGSRRELSAARACVGWRNGRGRGVGGQARRLRDVDRIP